MKLQCTHGRKCTTCPGEFLDRVNYHLKEAAGIMNFVHLNFDNVTLKKASAKCCDCYAHVEKS